MGRTGKAAVAAVTVLALMTACSKKDDTAATTASSTTTAGSSDSTATPKTEAPATTRTTVDTSNDSELAKQALVGTSDLPPGEWAKSSSKTTGTTSSSKSGAGDLLKTPSCKKLVNDAEAASAEATGKASEEFTQGSQKEVQLQNDVALYASAKTTAEIGRITDSGDFSTCISDALKTQMRSSGSSEAKITDLKATAFNIGVNKDDLNVDFVTGVSLRFTIEATGGVTAQAVGRLVFIGSGRGLSNVSLLAVQIPGLTGTVDIDSLDIKPTVKAAAQNLVSITKAN